MVAQSIKPFSGVSMRFIAIAVAFASLSAVACPNLAGKYAVCTSATGMPGSTDLVITQAIANGATVYTMTETSDMDGERETNTIVADGIERVMTEDMDGVVLEAKMKTSCAGDALVSSVGISIEGMEFGQIETKMTKVGNKLIQEVSGDILGEDVSDVITCE
jgi:hypothetical protein